VSARLAFVAVDRNSHRKVIPHQVRGPLSQSYGSLLLLILELILKIKIIYYLNFRILLKLNFILILYNFIILLLNFKRKIRFKSLIISLLISFTNFFNKKLILKIKAIYYL
jgi:hypothetical protein